MIAAGEHELGISFFYYYIMHLKDLRASRKIGNLSCNYYYARTIHETQTHGSYQ